MTATALLQCNKAQLSIYLVGRTGLGRTGCAVDADESPRPGMDGSKRERERDEHLSKEVHKGKKSLEEMMESRAIPSVWDATATYADSCNKNTTNN